MGILSGGNTNPPALAYANEYTSTDEPSIGYTMVYPLAMILRIIVIQILIMAIA
jgi:putative transport protein